MVTVAYLLRPLKKKGKISAKHRRLMSLCWHNLKKHCLPILTWLQHFDQADNVNTRLGSLGEDFLIAILLVCRYLAAPRFSVCHDRYDFHSPLLIHRTGITESFRNQSEPTQHRRPGRCTGFAGGRQYRGCGKYREVDAGRSFTHAGHFKSYRPDRQGCSRMHHYADHFLYAPGFLTGRLRRFHPGSSTRGYFICTGFHG